MGRISRRGKVTKHREGRGPEVSREMLTRMKKELEYEYLATFKKTVAMHEVFLTRLAQHPIFRTDHNFKVFLEYEQDVSRSLCYLIIGIISGGCKLFIFNWQQAT
ncbi:Sorting nexin-32-like [Homarus americanus]|uniref:Sorting nexin-32-like n=1 Tax=Homarus americanus TaxID=6706 RepID=A0A8J5JTM2_HOMAM|nr:Sorting nexin-32-like [Homarus americanus]